jgi:hypothetical protein
MAVVGPALDTHSMRSVNPLGVRVNATGPPVVLSGQAGPVKHGRSVRIDPDAGDVWQWWWRCAQMRAAQFLTGIEPPVIEMYGPVLAADELGLLETDLTVSRLCGCDDSYRRSDVLVLGRPAVMAGALVLSAVVNHRRKIAARRDATPRWRDEHPVHVWVTTHRLICGGDDGLESLWYNAITQFYPDLQRWSLTMSFDSGYPPVRLVGPAAPMLCLWTATATLGRRWAHDPRLAPLLAW